LAERESLTTVADILLDPRRLRPRVPSPCERPSRAAPGRWPRPARGARACLADLRGALDQERRPGHREPVARGWLGHPRSGPTARAPFTTGKLAYLGRTTESVRRNVGHGYLRHLGRNRALPPFGVVGGGLAERGLRRSLGRVYRGRRTDPGRRTQKLGSALRDEPTHPLRRPAPSCFRPCSSTTCRPGEGS